MQTSTLLTTSGTEALARLIACDAIAELSRRPDSFHARTFSDLHETEDPNMLLIAPVSPIGSAAWALEMMALDLNAVNLPVTNRAADLIDLHLSTLTES